MSFNFKDSDSYREAARNTIISIIIDSMQQGMKSPLCDERLLYSDKKWKNELSKQDIKYIKDKYSREIQK